MRNPLYLYRVSLTLAHIHSHIHSLTRSLSLSLICTLCHARSLPAEPKQQKLFSPLLSSPFRSAQLISRVHCSIISSVVFSGAPGAPLLVNMCSCPVRSFSTLNVDPLYIRYSNSNSLSLYMYSSRIALESTVFSGLLASS